MCLIFPSLMYNEVKYFLHLVYLMRSITIDELQGFRDAAGCVQVHLNLVQNGCVCEEQAGMERNTFNISTLSCFSGTKTR